MVPTIPVTCRASDQNGNPIVDGRFVAKLDREEIYQGFVVPEEIEGFTNDQGICVLNLWPNALGVNGSGYRVRAWNPDTGKLFLDGIAVVPNAPCNLDQIITLEPYPEIDAAQQALIASQAALAEVVSRANAAAASAAAALVSEQAADADRVTADAHRVAAADSAASAAHSANRIDLGALDAAVATSQANAQLTEDDVVTATSILAQTVALRDQAVAAEAAAEAAQTASEQAQAASEAAAAASGLSASNSQGFATDADASAVAALASQTAAGLSETAAATAEQAAEAAQLAAEAAQVAAEAAAGSAAASAADTAADAVTTTNLAGAAAQDATAAQNSALAADASADAALASETAAAASALAADGSALAAAASAVDATAQFTAADAARVAAQAAQADAETAATTATTQAGLAQAFADDVEAAKVAAETAASSAYAAATGVAGGVLSGNYPNPGFAVDMATQAELDAHKDRADNPHAVTKDQVGLGNVDNTADADKPVSTAQQGALDLKANLAGAAFTGNVGVPSLNGGQLAGHRNRIINGDMRISVRGTSFPAPASESYTLDRWKVGKNAGVMTVSQQADGPNTALGTSLRWQVTSEKAALAAGDFALIAQRIEGYNVADLIGRPFTFSFWVRSSKTGIHCVSFRNSGLDRSYVAEYTITAANTWEFKTITVVGGLTANGTWNWTTGMGLEIDFCLATGATYQGVPGAWQTGSIIGTANQVNCLDTVGNIFAITGVQLEPGTVATPFERRMDEDRLCKRYARPFGRGIVGIWMNTTMIRVSDTFDTPMRANPAATLLTTSPAAEDWAVAIYVATGATIVQALNTPTHGEFVVNGFSGPPATTPQRHAYLSADIAILAAEL